MMVHLGGLPPDSAMTRKRHNAPMGWNNTAEMTATVVDAINVLTRLYVNTHSESPIDPIPLTRRPYEVPVEPVEPKTVSFAELCAFVKET